MIPRSQGAGGLPDPRLEAAPGARTRVRDALSPALMPRGAALMRVLGIAVSPDDPRLAILEEATQQGDPLADALVEHMQGPHGAGVRGQLESALERGIETVPQAAEPLCALFDQLDHIPGWLDPERQERAARTLCRHGRDGLMALACASLMSGYLSAPATKPLAFTGALEKRTPRRLAATSKLTHDVARSDMSRFSAGFKTAVRVRLMHAQVRRNLLSSEAWRRDSWGVPINQRDLLATHLQFTVTYLGGVLLLGRLDTREEREAVMHLWRYVSYLLGVREDLLPRSLHEGLELAALFNATEPGPDDDGRRLARSLLLSFGSPPSGVRNPRIAEAFARFSVGYSRCFLGDQAAEALALPDTRWKYVPPLVALLRSPWELAQLLVPAARERAWRAGAAILDAQQEFALGGETPSFQPYAQSA